MRAARDEGVPSAISRTSMWRARKEIATRITPFGKLVQEFTIPLPDGDYDVAVQQPMAMMYVAYQECEPFRKLMDDSVAAHPPSKTAPWRIAMYCDEVGHNPIGRDNRKCEAIYWSFLEFGARALHTELAWFEVMVIRTTVVELLPGFMSRLFKLILNSLFFGEIHSFADGVLLSPSAFIVAKFSCLVADEKALKEILCAKGASGLKFCPICYEVCDHKTSDARATGCIRSTCLDVARFQANTDASVKAIILELQRMHSSYQRGEITKTAYGELTTFYGWNYDPECLLLCPRLRVGGISILMHDWAHMYIVSGIFNVEMQYLLIALNYAGYKPHTVDAFVQKWVWPRHMMNPYDMFCNKRVDLTHDHYKCDAHEAMQIYAVIAVFLALLPSEQCTAQVASFLALANVLDLLSCVKDGLVSPERLQDAIVCHLGAHQLAYGAIGWIPKHHLALHLVNALRTFGTILSLLTQERKHKVVKRWSRDRYSKTSFEIGLMEELTLEHLHSMQTDWYSDGLLNPVKPRAKLLESLRESFPQATEFLTARQVRVCHGGLISAGDVAFAVIKGERLLVEVWWHASVDGQCVSCISPWIRVDDALAASAHVVSFRKQDAPQTVHSNILVSPATHFADGDLVSAIMPAFLH